MKRVLPLALLMSFAGCATMPELPPEVSDAIPETTETVVSVLVPGLEGGASFYMTRTEITWELYDIFVYRRDLSGRASTGRASRREIAVRRQRSRSPRIRG